MDKVSALQPWDREFDPRWVTIIIPHMTQVLVDSMKSDLNKL